MQIQDIILCEDIRKEIGNKSSLMGIFADSININVPASFPGSVVIKICVFFRVLLEKDDPTPDQIKCEFESEGNIVHEVKLPVILPGSQTLLGVEIIGIPYKVEKSGEFVVKATAMSDDDIVAERTMSYPIKVNLAVGNP